MAKRKPLFIRKDSFKKSRLGRGRKKKRKWRRPRGRHSKLREKRKGYIKQPSIGYGRPQSTRGYINNLKPKIIRNAKELESIREGEIAIIGKMGKKKKIEIAKIALENKIRILNLNSEVYLKKIEEEKKERERKKAEERKKVERAKKEKEEKKEIKPEEKKEEKAEEKEKKEREKMLHKEIEKEQPKITAPVQHKEKKEMRRVA
ncbi:MAG: hypothetical protein K6T16_01905, partial [Candidatus Pacearchaeota archaeon]|nr:hypothetical protein [Candidatus Pacearchaeota archaeon]